VNEDALAHWGKGGRGLSRQKQTKLFSCFKISRIKTYHILCFYRKFKNLTLCNCLFYIAVHSYCFMYFVSTVLFCVLLVCKCVLCYCHLVSTQLQLTNIISYISYIIYHTISYHTIYHIIYYVMCRVICHVTSHQIKPHHIKSHITYLISHLMSYRTIYHIITSAWKNMPYKAACIVIFIYVYVFILLCMFWSVYCFIVLFCVPFVCKCVLYCTTATGGATQLQLTNTSYHVETVYLMTNTRCSKHV
jgi:hypothetical protein